MSQRRTASSSSRPPLCEPMKKHSNARSEPSLHDAVNPAFTWFVKQTQHEKLFSAFLPTLTSMSSSTTLDETGDSSINAQDA